MQYEAIQWGPVGQEQTIDMKPGNPNTTFDRSAIQDHAAQDVLNCAVNQGVWQLSQRCRQFAPSPILPSTTSCSNSAPTTDTAVFANGCASISAGIGGSGIKLATCTAVPP